MIKYYSEWLVALIWVILPNQGHTKIPIWNWWSEKTCNWGVMGFKPFLFMASMFGLKYGLKVTTRWSMWYKAIEIIGFFEPQWSIPEMCFNKKEQLPTTQVILEGVRKDPYHIPLQFESLGTNVWTWRTIGRSIGQSFWKFAQGFLATDWSTCWSLHPGR